MNKNELPDGWKLEKISNLVDNYLSGFACAISNLVEKDGYVQLRPFNIEGGKLNLEIMYQVPLDMVDTNLYALKKGDILFNNTNSTELVGKSALVDKDYPFAFSNHINRIRVKTNLLKPEYFHYYLFYMWYKGHFSKHCKKWIGQSGYTFNELNDQSILLPPLSEQQKIISKIDEQMAQIEIMKKEAEKQIEFQEKIRNSYLNKLFSSPQLELSSRCILGNITKITSGSTPLRSDSSYHGGKIPWIKTGELQNNIINDSEEKVTQKALDETSLKLNPPETLLVAMYGQGKTRGMTGLVKIESTTNQACCAIYPNYNIFIPEYLQMWFMANYENLRFMSEGRGGNQPNLNGELIKQLEVPFPSKVIQKSLIEAYNKGLELVKEINSNIDTQLRAINQLPNSVLDEVFGKY
jgi:type I restriction enzyme, S subunit